MSNEFKESIKVDLKKAESPKEILEGIEKEEFEVRGTYKGSRVAKMPGLMISETEHDEIVDKTINRVLEKLEEPGL